MTVFILTDIPVWVRPLERALTSLGAKVLVGDDPEIGSNTDLIVNRVSTQLLRVDEAKLSRIRQAFGRWESGNQMVINGARCFEIGLSKVEQHALFQSCGVSTPATKVAIPGGRALPGRSVLLKPPAGGFGKGIQILQPDEPAPSDLDPSIEWIEQERIEPADGMVHRIEFVGDQILYDAATPLVPNEFDYCLANAGDNSALTPEKALDPEIARLAKKIAARGKMKLGAIEYFVLKDGNPCFFDFNPVSSLHPRAADCIGAEPLELVVDFIFQSATSPSS
ncbi:MAG: hypothetical protein AAF065_00470 [Verrucomicrobiota bacterium]